MRSPFMIFVWSYKYTARYLLAIILSFAFFNIETASLFQCFGMVITDELVDLMAVGFGILWIGTYIQRQMSILNPSVMIIVDIISLDIICAYAARFTILGLLQANISAISIVMPTMCSVKKGSCEPFTYGQTPSHYYVDIRLMNWISFVGSFMFSL